MNRENVARPRGSAADPPLRSLDDEPLKGRVQIGDAETVAAALGGFAEADARLAIIGMPGLIHRPTAKP